MAQPHMPQPKELRVVLVGFGNVGRDLVRLFRDYNDHYEDRHGVRFVVPAITTGSHGSLIDEDGIDLDGSPLEFGPQRDSLDIIENISADVVVELSTLNVESGEPAISHLRRALTTGKHAVTANKGPIAFAYQELMDLARKVNRKLLFESTVMDGTPLFNMARSSFLGTRVTGFKGILNSTTNFILDELEQGGSLEEAIEEAQRRGFAEADPSMDIDGWDAAAKTAVLANVLLGAHITPQDVQRTGLRDISGDDVAAALREGEQVKLLCEARALNSKAEGETQVYARVAPVRLPVSDPLAQIAGTSSAVVLSTELMGDITIVENDPTLEQTAYGVINDLLEIALS